MTVAPTMKKINKRIPGILPPPPKTELDGKITDLKSKTIAELLELRERQLKLLNNKQFINKLGDKGAKIQALHDKIVNELKAKQEEEQACRLLGKLTLDATDKQSVQNLEWSHKTQKPNTYLDSDDDSEPEDVMHILSQSTAQEKIVKVIAPEKPLITPEDLIKIDELPHVKYIVNKTESTKPKSTGNFKPYKTTISDVHNPEKEVHRKKHKNWEVTAATPPPSVHGPAKVLSIEQSLKLQKEYNFNLKMVEAQHAAEKLLAGTGIKMAELPKDLTSFGHYRDMEKSDDSDIEGSDKEVVDEEPEKGGVVFTVLK